MQGEQIVAIEGYYCLWTSCNVVAVESDPREIGTDDPTSNPTSRRLEEVTREQAFKAPAMDKAANAVMDRATNEGEVDDVVMMPEDYSRVGLVMAEESADWPLSTGEYRGCARNDESTSEPFGGAAVDTELAVDTVEGDAVGVNTTDDYAAEAANEANAIDGAVDAATAGVASEADGIDGTHSRCSSS